MDSACALSQAADFASPGESATPDSACALSQAADFATTTESKKKKTKREKRQLLADHSSGSAEQRNIRGEKKNRYFLCSDTNEECTSCSVKLIRLEWLALLAVEGAITGRKTPQQPQTKSLLWFSSFVSGNSPYVASLGRTLAQGTRVRNHCPFRSSPFNRERLSVPRSAERALRGEHRGVVGRRLRKLPTISGGHINPAVTFGLFLARKVTLVRALLYMIAQCLGAICGVGLVKGFQSAFFVLHGGGANELSGGYSKGTGLAAEIIGTFVLVYTVFAATDPKRNARDSHVPVLAPLPIGFAVFMVHLATIPVTGTGINPARSFGAAVIYNNDKAWDDQWIFWVGPFIGAAIAAGYHQYILRAGAVKALGSFRSS